MNSGDKAFYRARARGSQTGAASLVHLLEAPPERREKALCGFRPGRHGWGRPDNHTYVCARCNRRAFKERT